MLSKQKISDQLKKFGCSEPKFYYRTKTIFNEKLTTVYLIFVQKYVVLAITDPRNVDRDELEFIERIPFFELSFFKEDNMYLLMKWKKRHLLIGFKDADVLNKFCEKISDMRISFGKKSKKRVLGNDDGESVSYKLDNESIDHISTDTGYDVLSFNSEKDNQKEKIDKIQTEQNSKTESLKSFSSKTPKNSNRSTYTAQKEVGSSKLSEDLKRRSRMALEQDSEIKNIGNKMRTLQFSKIFEKKTKEEKHNLQHFNHKRNTSENCIITSEQINIKKIKAQIEFGQLNFFVLSNPSFQALCTSISQRLCKHFDTEEKNEFEYNIMLLEHFKVFIRQNEKLFKMDSEADFFAAIYGNEEKLDIVIENI